MSKPVLELTRPLIESMINNGLITTKDQIEKTNNDPLIFNWYPDLNNKTKKYEIFILDDSYLIRPLGIKGDLKKVMKKLKGLK